MQLPHAEKATESMKATTTAATKATKNGMQMKKNRRLMKKRVSALAKGRFAKVFVLSPRHKEKKTVSGLTKEELARSKVGKLVSRQHKSAFSKKLARVKELRESFMKARVLLGISPAMRTDSMNMAQSPQGKKVFYAKRTLLYSS